MESPLTVYWFHDSISAAGNSVSVVCVGEKARIEEALAEGS
jgi:hypothetical protein